MGDLRRIGSFCLDEFPRAVVRFACERWASPRYRLDGLIERYGADMGLLELLGVLAKCERRTDLSQRCGARYPDLARSRPSFRSFCPSLRERAPNRRFLSNAVLQDTPPFIGQILDRGEGGFG